MIKISYRSCDGFSKTKSFKTLKGAQKFAQYYVGASPEIGRGYAVAGDGVGRVACQGCSLAELFPSQEASQ